MEAVDLYRANVETIDLVIMDIVMPEMSGDQALKIIGQINPDIKAILVSGYIDVDRFEGILRQDRQIILQKPLAPEMFSGAIDVLLGADDRTSLENPSGRRIS